MSVFIPPDSLVGSWIVREGVGSGGHGEVFRVVHKDRPDAGSYALKVALKAGDERFEREAWLLSRIRHRSVPRFEESGWWRSPQGEAHPYIVMQWVEGMSLYAWALEHGLTLRQAIRQLAQGARALEATHLHGVHRDVKGANIRVSYEDHAVLLDFGSGWYRQASPLTGRALPPGTDNYRSPQLLFFELALGLGAGEYYVAQPADDVYSLGVTAYRLLEGDYPPSDAGSRSGSAKVKPPKPPRGLDALCPELSELIVRMLSEDPEARGSATTVAEELEALLEYARPALDEPWRGGSSRQATTKVRPPELREGAPREQEKPSPSATTPRKPEPSVAPAAPGEPTPRSAGAPPREPAPRVAPAPSKASALSLGPAGALFLMVVLGVLLTLSVDRTGGANTEQGSASQASGSADGGTAVGEEGLASVTPAPMPPFANEKITREMPDGPLPGQRLPPCTQRGVVVINGGCWRRPSPDAEKPPCDSVGDPDLDLYEHQGRCYSPILTTAKRVPTSKEPQKRP